MVRAKFRVTKIEDAEWDVWRDGETVKAPIRTVELWPVCDGTEENKKFYATTPGGNIVLGSTNRAATDQFSEGQEFYVDFTPAGK